MARIKKEILKQPLSIVFDGITHVCETFVLVLHYVTNNQEIKQCVRQLKCLAKTIWGRSCRANHRYFVYRVKIAPQAIVVVMRDQAAVNDVAIRTIRVMC